MRADPPTAGSQMASGWRPPISPQLVRAGAFYRMGFFADGFPGVRIAGTLVAQPLYGTYVLTDLLRQYSLTSDPAMRLAIDRFARVSIRRMRPFRGALVFWNPDQLGFGRDGSGQTYSGLDMAYYAVELYRASMATADESLRAAADACFRALLVDAELGGVLYRWGPNVAVAEVPSRPRDLTLNGWLSVLASVHRYAELSASSQAEDLFEQSTSTLARLLPLYDDAAMANSRYALSGRLQARLVVDDPAALHLEATSLDIPEEGSFAARLGGPPGWWTRIEAADVVLRASSRQPRRGIVRLDLQMSRLSFPRPNVLQLALSTSRPMTLRLQVLVAPPSPQPSAASMATWRDAAKVRLQLGVQVIRLPIPWSLAESVGAATSFGHQMDGFPVNIYHAIHVRRLDELFSLTGIDRLKQYADRWRLDLCSWAGDSRYSGLGIALQQSAVSPDQYCRILGWVGAPASPPLGRRLQ